MKIIINNYYKLKLNSKLTIFLLEYKKRFTIDSAQFEKNGYDAIYKFNEFKYCKYRINLSNFKNVDYEIIFNNKSLCNIKAAIFYFDFVSKDNIHILTKNEYNKNELLIKKNRHKSSNKFWHLYWNSLHYLSYNYPENPSLENKRQIINLISKMRKNGIACSYCRSHFNKWCVKNDIKKYIDNRDNLISFFINAHNDVNNRNNKKILSRNEVDKIYLNFDYNYLLKYGLDVITLFNNNKLDNLPDIINTYTRHILLDEFNIIKFA